MGISVGNYQEHRWILELYIITQRLQNELLVIIYGYCVTEKYIHPIESQ
jgi:hypothetical protein